MSAITDLTAPEPITVPAPEPIVLNPQQAIRAYGIADTAIAKMRESYLPLVIRDIHDKAGEAAVHDARMIVKRHRVEVENKRKALKAGALEFGRVVDAEAKRLTALLEPIEEHLQAEEDSVKEERDRIKRERLQARVDKLTAVESTLPISVVESMPDEKFAEFLADATKSFEAKRERERIEAERRAEEARIEAEARLKREAEEAAARKAEEDRLAAERQKLEAERQRLEAAREEQRRIQEAELEAEKARVAAERRALEEEKARLAAEQRRTELETARAQAAERAKREEAARVERERVEAEERAKAEAAERDRLEALRPDREKLLAWAKSTLIDPFPSVSPAAEPTVDRMLRVIKNCHDELRRIIDEELPAA